MITDGIRLGEFEITSGVMRVTDPCYDKETWCSGTVDAKNGTWEAFIETSNEGGWGNRVSSLTVLHMNSGRSYSASDWDMTSIDVGVDSGQAGFFDNALYPDGERTGEFGDLDTFYGKVCDLTCETKESAGVIPFGAVSSSGYGDGGYKCYVRRMNGLVVAAKIVFISDDEEDEDDY